MVRYLHLIVYVLFFALLCTIAQEINDKQIQTVGPKFESKLLIVTTIDGKIHAVDPQSGEIKWSVKTQGGSLVSSSQTSNTMDDSLIEDVENENDDPNHVFIPSVTGNVYVWNKEEGLQKFPSNIREIVAQAPFYSQDGTFYMASKRTRVLILDSLDGSVVCEYNTDNFSESIPSSCSLRDDVVFVVRVDYAVQAVKNGQMKWNITYSDVQPSKVSTSEQSKGTPLAFTTSDGLLYLLDKPDDIPKVLQFSSQPVNIFQQSESTFKKVPLPAVMNSIDSDKGVYINRKEDELYALELRRLKHHKSNIHKLLPPAILPPRITVPSNEHPIGEYLPTNALIPYQSDLTGFHKVKPFIGSEQENSKINELIDDVPEIPIVLNPQTNQLHILVNSLIVLFACAGVISVATIVKQKLSKTREPIPEPTPEPVIEEPVQEPEPIEEEPIVQPVLDIPEGYDQVGKFLISKTDILGHGSNGTIVYRGELDGRTVAVKRMLREFYHIATKEISLLIQSDQHPHVVRYFAKEQDDQFVYLALEYCPHTLDEFFDQHLETAILSKKRLLHQLTLAIEHIHSLGIVHRDLKPGNVLISTDNKVKLSDMGLGRRLEHNRSSFHTEHSAGTLGWQAPESLLLQQEAENNSEKKKDSSGSGNSTGVLQRLTRSVDMFSLGCIMYYILTNGEHPFGDRYQREANIVKGKFKLDHPSIRLEVKKLLENLLDSNPEKRITAQDVLKHPVFWSNEKKLCFLGDVSDQLGKEKSNSVVYHKLQSRKRFIFSKKMGGSLSSLVRDELVRWDANLDQIVLTNCLQFRKYDHTHVWDLLRCIRNIRSHYREYDVQVHELMKPVPTGIYTYFDKLFPNMFYEVYDTVCKNSWHEKPIFAHYFEITEKVLPLE